MPSPSTSLPFSYLVTMSLGHLFVQGDLLVWWWYGRDRADKLAMLEDPKLEQPELDPTVLSEHIKKKI